MSRSPVEARKPPLPHARRRLPTSAVLILGSGVLLYLVANLLIYKEQPLTWGRPNPRVVINEFGLPFPAVRFINGSADPYREPDPMSANSRERVSWPDDVKLDRSERIRFSDGSRVNVRWGWLTVDLLTAFMIFVLGVVILFRKRSGQL